MTKLFILVATLSLCSASAQAADECEAAFKKTMAEVDAGNGFDAIENFYKNHGKCDDGAYAAGIDGAVADSLDNDWSNLGKLQPKLKDKGFKKFFFSHIDAEVSASEKEMSSVLQKSKKKCPKGLAQLCKEIGAAAKAALEQPKN
jgi:hypothetical protein